MGQKETKVTDLCSELAITRQMLYRHVAPDGTLRKDGLKVVEGGKIRYAKKKSLPRPGLIRFSVQLILRPLLRDAYFRPGDGSPGATAASYAQYHRESEGLGHAGSDQWRRQYCDHQ